jgi:hypothetical protein
MSTAVQNLTRQAVDRAEPLAFPSKRSALITISYKGVPVAVTVEDASAVAVEKLVDSLLARDGWAAPVPNGGNTPVPSPQRQARTQRPALPEPWYKPDGTPCCPWHQRPLKEGRYGLYCPSKAEGEQANDKGYCIFSLKD